MNPADRIDMLGAMGVFISLAQDTRKLRAFGNAAVIEAARPTLGQHRLALIAYLIAAQNVKVSHPAKCKVPNMSRGLPNVDTGVSKMVPCDAVDRMTP